MEQPYSGRAKITRSIRELKIEIPSEKRMYHTFFLLVWFAGWTFGEFFAINGLIESFEDDSAKDFGDLFLIIWLVGWTIGGTHAIRHLTWIFFGTEVILFKDKTLTINRKFDLFRDTKEYHLDYVKDFSINPNSISTKSNEQEEENDVLNLGKNGVLKFDYGMKTILFATGIDEAEGKFLLEIICESGFLKI